MLFTSPNCLKPDKSQPLEYSAAPGTLRTGEIKSWHPWDRRGHNTFSSWDPWDWQGLGNFGSWYPWDCRGLSHLSSQYPEDREGLSHFSSWYPWDCQELGNFQGLSWVGDGGPARSINFSCNGPRPGSAHPLSTFLGPARPGPPIFQLPLPGRARPGPQHWQRDP